MNQDEIRQDGRMNELTRETNKEQLGLKLLMFFPCLVAAIRSLDNDIWFLLSHGRYILENGIPRIEPFTIHKGFEFVMQQWLSAGIFYTLYSAAGTIGLKLLVSLCYGLIIYISFKLCMKVSGNNFFVSFCISLAVGLFLFFFMVTRPTIFSCLIIVTELYVLECFIQSKDKRLLLTLPVLSLLLVNLQAAMWPMLFVILIPYFIDSFRFKIKGIASEGFDKRFLSAAAAGMILAGFINPYGIDSMTYLFRSYGFSQISKLVIEMKPADITSGIGILIFGSLLSVIMIYCFYRNGKTKIRYILLTLGTAYLSLSSVKSFSFFVLSGLFPLAYWLSEAKLKTRQETVTKKTKTLRIVLIVLIAAVIPIPLAAMAKSSGDYVLQDKRMNEVLDYIIAEDRETVLYTGYNDGGMAEFRGLKTYMDPRAEVFLKTNNKKEDIMTEYYELQSGSVYYKDILEKYGFTHLIVTEEDILAVYLPHDPDYAVVFSNEDYTLYETVTKP
jgi:hypothetical protein